MSVYVERKNTVKISFARDAPKVLAYEIHEWIYETLQLPVEQVLMIQMDNLTRCFYIKVQSESLLQDILERTHGEASFVFSTGERGTVKLEHAGVGYRVVKLYHLPVEVPSELVFAAFKSFGSILAESTEQWSPTYRYPSSSGVRSVRILLTKHIPSFVYIAGHRVLVVYPGQPPTCAYCHQPGHFKNDCPRKRGIVQTPHEADVPAWTVLTSDREFPVLRSSTTSAAASQAETSSSYAAVASASVTAASMASTSTSTVTSVECAVSTLVATPLLDSRSANVTPVAALSTQLRAQDNDDKQRSTAASISSDEQTLSAEEPHLTESSVSDSEEHLKHFQLTSKRRKGDSRAVQCKVLCVEQISGTTNVAAVSQTPVEAVVQPSRALNSVQYDVQGSNTSSGSWNEDMDAVPPDEQPVNLGFVQEAIHSALPAGRAVDGSSVISQTGGIES